MKYLMTIILFTQLLLAAPAFQGKRTFTQPNGETITYRLQGDEYLHWLESDDGDIMLYSKKNKRIESATIESDSLKASGRAISHRKRSATAKNSKGITKDMLFELQQKRRVKHLSKMKKPHKVHTKHYQ